VIASLPAKSVFQRYHSDKHLSEFCPQDGGESQLASKLRHCRPMNNVMPCTRAHCKNCPWPYAAVVLFDDDSSQSGRENSVVESAAKRLPPTLCVSSSSGSDVLRYIFATGSSLAVGGVEKQSIADQISPA